MNRDTAIGLLRRTPFTPGGVPEFYAGRSGAALQQLLAPNITWSTDVTWPSRSSGGSAGTGRSDALHRTGTSSGVRSCSPGRTARVEPPLTRRGRRSRSLPARRGAQTRRRRRARNGLKANTTSPEGGSTRCRCVTHTSPRAPSQPAPSASCWAGSPTCCSSTRELTDQRDGPNARMVFVHRHEMYVAAPRRRRRTTASSARFPRASTTTSAVPR
jgi:hypothetical protein